MSTNANPGATEVDGKSKPLSVQLYNKYMLGVDRADQLRSYYKIGRPSNKYWKYINFFLLDTCIVNAWLLYDASVPVKRRSRYSQLDFRIDLYKALRAGFSSRKRSVGRTSRVALAEVVPQDNLGGHTLVTITEGRKKVCRLVHTFSNS